MKVGFFQFCPERANVDRNLDIVRSRTSTLECDLLVLPELFNTGYLFSSKEEAEQLAEDMPSGRTTQALLEIARERKMAIVGGLAERAGERLYNSSVLVSPTGEVFSYRKLHLFGYEKETFLPGNREPGVFDVQGVKIGMMICFDWYFPETARILMLKGAQIICHPSNLVLSYCQSAMPIRCLENRVFAITANRIGAEEVNGRELTFTGRSIIVDTSGTVLAEAPVATESLMMVDIFPDEARQKMMTQRNELISDRRVEHYGRLLHSRLREEEPTA